LHRSLSLLSQVLSGRKALDFRQPEAWLLLLCVLALGLRLLLLLQPLPWFVSMMMADDFFYYAQTAYNVAHGAGSTLDGGLTRHNGYQPLFLSLLVTGFLLGLGKTTMIPVAVSMLTIAWLAAMVLAYQIGRELGARWGALIAPAIMGFSSELVRASISGFETALVTALLLAVFLACLQRRPGWLIGLLLGLAGLARLDSGLAAVPVAVVLIQQKRWRDLFVTGTVAALVVAPWCTWSWLEFGSPLPLSGVVKSWFGRLGDLWQGPVVFARETIYRILGNRRLLPPELALVAGALLIAGLVQRGRHLWWLLLYALGAPVVYAVLTGSRYLAQFMRYCVPAFCLLTILVFSCHHRRPRLVLGLLLASILWTEVHFLDWALDSPPLADYVGLSQQEVPAVLDEILDADDRVGCFDSGAISYFARQPVINLDGLANAEVVKMLSAKEGGTWATRYRKYLRDKGITVLIGGTGFSWVRLFSDLDTWSPLHEPLALREGGEIVFLRVPSPE
jgi:hypothetical protein